MNYSLVLLYILYVEKLSRFARNIKNKKTTGIENTNLSSLSVNK